MLQTVDMQRNALINSPGTSLLDCADYAQIVRDDPRTPPSVGLKANKQVIDIGGFNAPTQIEQKSMSLELQFHSYDVDELQDIINEL